jgi:hypothetical protein
MEDKRYKGYEKVFWRPLLPATFLGVLLVVVAIDGTWLLFFIALLFVYNSLLLFKCYGILYSFKGYNIYEIASNYYVISKKRCMSNYILEASDLVRLSEKYYLDTRPF